MLDNNIITILNKLEGQYIHSIEAAHNISLKRKDYSRAVIDLYLNKRLGCNLKDYLTGVGLVFKTTPISHGSLLSVERLRLSSLHLKSFVNESWENSELSAVLSGIIILPLVVDAKNLGQGYRKVGKAFIWKPGKSLVDEIKTEWLWYQSYALKGAIPNKRGGNLNQLTFPTETNSKFIHMRPHSVKGKFEVDAFGNEVRKMAFYLNPAFLRTLLLKNL